MTSTAYQPMADLNRALASAGDRVAFDSLLRAAESGCLRAQSLVGLAYHTGRGVPVNYDHAAAWYQKAAAGGDSYAIVNLGVMSLLGQGCIPDDLEAFIWLQSAVGLGHKRFLPVLEVLERRITGDHSHRSDRSDQILTSVSPQTPAFHPCTRAECDPCRCDAA